ncbi:MAG: T9SS type A sorting domain-containing protein [Bacteroidales bacterium]|nr:T9SS type A sorting domain-containing protein [Bacteroidales bacterium]
MKKLLLLLVIVLCYTVFAQAQISLGSGDFPSAGLTLKYFQAKDTLYGLTDKVILGDPGADGVYDLTGITPYLNENINEKWLSPSVTGFADKHPNANVAKYWRTFLIMYKDTAGWLWLFFKSDANGLYLSGSSLEFDESMFSNLTAGPHQFMHNQSPVSLEFMSSNYNLGYQYKDSTVSRIKLKDTPLNVYGKLILDLSVDGYGKLKTPKGEYDVLRVKQTLIQKDAFVLHEDTLKPIEYFDEDSEKFYQYVYYAKGIGAPVAVVDMEWDFRRVIAARYVDAAPASLVKYPVKNNFSVNNFQDILVVNAYNNKTNIIKLYDYTGKQIFHSDFSTELRISKNSFPTGLYFINIYNSNSNITYKLFFNR